MIWQSGKPEKRDSLIMNYNKIHIIIQILNLYFMKFDLYNNININSLMIYY